MCLCAAFGHIQASGGQHGRGTSSPPACRLRGHTLVLRRGRACRRGGRAAGALSHALRKGEAILACRPPLLSVLPGRPSCQDFGACVYDLSSARPCKDAHDDPIGEDLSHAPIIVVLIKHNCSSPSPPLLFLLLSSNPADGNAT